MPACVFCCRYYVRVAAVNTAGMGPFAVATQPVAAPYFPYAVPNVPAGAILTSGIGASTSALQVSVGAHAQVPGNVWSTFMKSHVVHRRVGGAKYDSRTHDRCHPPISYVSLRSTG
jgi:hypothetical protein